LILYLTDVRHIAYLVSMTMIRKSIIKRMAELNMNPNQLSEILKRKIPRRTIYDFLSGRTDARTEVASELIKVLGIKLISENKQRKVR
jgi:predicted transcriptional regulator